MNEKNSTRLYKKAKTNETEIYKERDQKPGIPKLNVKTEKNVRPKIKSKKKHTHTYAFDRMQFAACLTYSVTST